MSKKKVFEQLADELPDDERKDLLKEIQEDLKKLHRTDTVNTDQADDEDLFSSNKKNLEKIYHEISVLEKIKIILLKIFTKKSIDKLLEEYLIRKIGKDIEHEYPGIIEQKGGFLKERFYNEIIILQNCIEILSEPVLHINKTGPAGLYQTIASSEMAAFEDAVKKATDPECIIEEIEKPDSEIMKQHINKKFNDIIMSIEPEEKKDVYEIVKMYFFMSQLIIFPFSSLKKSFVIGPNGSRTCLFVNCRKHLAQLNSILSSIKNYDISQYKKLFKYLFTYFSYQENGGLEDNFESPAKLTEKAVNSMQMIMNFQNNIPLLKILKYMYKNLDYKPDLSSGGEDWFTVYKKYLKEMVDKRTEKYIFNQKRNDIIKKLSGYIPDIFSNEKYSIKIRLHDKIYEIPSGTILGYLFLFYEKYYITEIDPAVSKILLDGIFYKDSNRKELAEAYNFMLGFPSDFNSFLNKIKPDGDRIRELQALIQEDKTFSIRNKKISNFINSISTEASKLYSEYFDTFSTIKNILGGVVSGSASRKYDTLSNIADVCVSKTIMSLSSIDKIFRTMSDILNTFKEYDELSRRGDIENII